VRVPYREVTNLSTVVDWLDELGARTVVLDVEPLVAVWDTGEAELERGVEEAVALLAEVPSLESVGFATNSLRRLSGAVAGDAFFVTAARKPLLTRPYRDLPHPGVVVRNRIVRQRSPLLLHLVGGLPRAADHFADPSHRLRVRRHHADGAEVVQHVLGGNRLGADP